MTKTIYGTTVVMLRVIGEDDNETLADGKF
jgi:hypothetical protein